MRDDVVVMTSLRWKVYKRVMGTIPTCCCCHTPILLNDKCSRSSGKVTKYFCEKCSNKDIIVYKVERRPLMEKKKDCRILVTRQ